MKIKITTQKAELYKIRDVYWYIQARDIFDRGAKATYQQQLQNFVHFGNPWFRSYRKAEISEMDL